MTITPEPFKDFRLSAELKGAIDEAILKWPTPADRSRMIYSIVRECYDAVRGIHGSDADTDERASLGKVSDAADHHQGLMNGWGS